MLQNLLRQRNIKFIGEEKKTLKKKKEYYKKNLLSMLFRWTKKDEKLIVF